MLCSMPHPLAPHAFAPHALLDALMHDVLAHDVLPAPAPPAAHARVSSTDGTHTVSLVAPGLAPSDVIIEAHPDGRLTIRGENKNKRKIDWSIAMPQDAEVDEASAEVADGLITVSMKRTKASTVQIGVNTAAGHEEDEEADDSYTLTIVAAGFAAADLALSIEDGVLTVNEIKEGLKKAGLIETIPDLKAILEDPLVFPSHVTDETAESIAVKQTEVDHKTESKQRTDESAHNFKRELELTHEELDKALDYYDKLKTQCVDTGLSYEERVKAREEEVQSLQEALKILNQQDLA